MMTVEEMIKRKKELGYSNKQLSTISGVPLGTLQKIMSKNTSVPRYQTLRALEAVLSPKYAPNAAIEHTTAEPYYAHEESTYGLADGTSARKIADQSGGKTLKDYLALPDDIRVEMIDGVFYNMSSPSSAHQLISGEIFAQLRAFIRENKGDCIPFIAPMDIQLDCDDKTIVEPDVFVICDRNKITKRRIIGAPDLVIEILSPGSWFHDTQRKLKKYKAAGVKEYWIIMPEHLEIQVYRFAESDEPMGYTFQDQIPVGIWQDACKVDFTAIYEMISFLYDT